MTETRFRWAELSPTLSFAYSTSHLYEVGDLKALGPGPSGFQGLHGYFVAFSPPPIWSNNWNAPPEARNDALDEPS
jgi:hypothetical protein